MQPYLSHHRFHDIEALGKAVAGLGDDELRTLQCQLIENPEAGDVIQETGGVTLAREVSP